MKSRIIFILGASIFCASNAPSALAFGHNAVPHLPRHSGENTSPEPMQTTESKDTRHTDTTHEHDIVIDSEYMKNLQYRQIVIKESDDLEVIRLDDGFMIKQK